MELGVLAALLGLVHAPLVAWELWKRPEGVRPWLVPTALVLGLWIAVMLLVLLTGGQQWGRYDDTVAVTGFTGLVLSGLWLLHAVVLGVVRGLTPTGDAHRWRRSSLLAVAAVLCLACLGLRWVWVLPCVLPALVWVLAFRRQGSVRLARGGELAAGFLVAALWTGGVARLFAAWLRPETFDWGAVWALPVLGLLLTLWTLVLTRLHWVGWAGMMAQPLLALLLTLVGWSRFPIPVEVDPPMAVDWLGDISPVFRSTEVTCIELAGAGTQFGACADGPVAVTLRQDGSSLDALRAMQAAKVDWLAIGRGDGYLTKIDRRPAAPDIQRFAGQTLHRGRPVTYFTLRAHDPMQPLFVEASPDISVGLFVKMCATAGTRVCSLMER